MYFTKKKNQNTFIRVQNMLNMVFNAGKFISGCVQFNELFKFFGALRFFGPILERGATLTLKNICNGSSGKSKRKLTVR